jgi:outer membrane lipoprotein carrier protein
MTLNNFIRRGALMVAAALLSTSLIAQKAPASSSPSAHEVAQRVDRHYNQLRSLRTQFYESYEGLGRARAESGTLLLARPGRMRWDYTKPAGKIFLLDGKYAWFYSKGDQQVQRIGAKELDDLRSPLRFLLGHTQLEKEIDHLTLSPAANGNFTLAGVPHGQEKRVQRLALTVTPEGSITAIEIQETDGAVTRFAFSGEQTNAPIPADTFKFTPPAVFRSSKPCPLCREVKGARVGFKPPVVPFRIPRSPGHSGMAPSCPSSRSQPAHKTQWPGH